MSETRTVYTAEQMESMSTWSDHWCGQVGAVRDAAAMLRQAAAQARVLAKLEAWLPTLREQPHAPTVGQIEQQLDRLLREEGLR